MRRHHAGKVSPLVSVYQRLIHKDQRSHYHGVKLALGRRDISVDVEKYRSLDRRQHRAVNVSPLVFVYQGTVVDIVPVRAIHGSLFIWGLA